MNAKDAIAINQQAVADGMIKIGIPIGTPPSVSREWCWAQRVAPSYARLENCCVYGEGINFGDIVEFCEQGDEDGGPHEILKRFVRVVTRGSTQRDVLYATIAEARNKSDRTIAKLRRRIVGIRRYCDSLPVEVRPHYVEGLTPGLACIAFPADISDDRVDELLANCPHLIRD
jgi:hypothetical protein